MTTTAPFCPRHSLVESRVSLLAGFHHWTTPGSMAMFLFDNLTSSNWLYIASVGHHHHLRSDSNRINIIDVVIEVSIVQCSHY